MHRWSGKVAVVTGASSGIGSAVALDLVSHGIIVVGLARRVERIDALRSQISPDSSGELHSFKCDVSNEEDIVAAFKWVTSTLGGVDILINNAGVSIATRLVEPGNAEQMRSMLDTNVLGPALCTREAFQSMKARGVAGHVVLINSVVGHRIPIVPPLGSLNMYAPSKWAVTGMTEVLRQEFMNAGTKIKITSISPGLVKTEMVPEDWSKMDIPMLDAADVSAAVTYVLGTPPHVQVHELTIQSVCEAF